MKAVVRRGTARPRTRKAPRAKPTPRRRSRPASRRLATCSARSPAPLVEVEGFDFSYGVYANGARVICFAEGRIGYREWARRNGRLADIHSLDDRLDHDVDELMA
jgi:hypothetical protein